MVLGVVTYVYPSKISSFHIVEVFYDYLPMNFKTRLIIREVFLVCAVHGVAWESWVNMLSDMMCNMNIFTLSLVNYLAT